LQENSALFYYALLQDKLWVEAKNFVLFGYLEDEQASGATGYLGSCDPVAGFVLAEGRARVRVPKGKST
jgi:hypothetical protein